MLHIPKTFQPPNYTKVPTTEPPNYSKVSTTERPNYTKVPSQQPAATFQQTKLHCYTHQNSTAQPAQAMITSMKHTLNIHDRFNMKQKLESK